MDWLLILALVALGAGLLAARWARGNQARSVDEYGQAMRALRERNPAGSGATGPGPGSSTTSASPRPTVRPVTSGAVRVVAPPGKPPLDTAGGPPAGVRRRPEHRNGVEREGDVADGHGQERWLVARNGRRATDEQARRTNQALARLEHLRAPEYALTATSPRALGEVARMVGLFEDGGARHPGVEANARLTGTTGLVLMVLFVLEGLTLPVITRFLSWHVAIGLALVPPVLLKIGATLWRFGHYYLGDRRYRAAGPPHPVLRVLGPVVITSTSALIVSGVALWLAGPRSLLLLRVHQAAFVVWFAAVAVHLLAHLLRASRLAAADSRDARHHRRGLPGARGRRMLVAASVAVGMVVALLGFMVSTPWAKRSSFPPPAAHNAMAPRHRVGVPATK